jgi:hypothetical protein
MSTTSLPVDARPSVPKYGAVKPPVLASDILREEVAPRAPARTMIRVWLWAFAAACALSAIAARFGFGPHTTNVFEGSLAVAILAALGAAVPAPYAGRAFAAVLTGLALLVLGAMDRGPLAPIGHAGVLQATAGLLLVTSLPATLFFRARYRAFREARLVLTVALVASLPALAFGILGAADGTAPVAVRIADTLVAASALTGLFGYMGAETTGGCDRWAGVVLVVYAARIAVNIVPELLDPAGAGDSYGQWGYVTASAGALAASTLTAVGLFQILALFFAERAREVDVHRVAAQSHPEDHEDREARDE